MTRINWRKEPREDEMLKMEREALSRKNMYEAIQVPTNSSSES